MIPKGDTVRRMRRVIGITQEQLASLLGTHATTVQQWESEKATATGHHARSLVMLEELARKIRPIPLAGAAGALSVTFWDALKRTIDRDPALAFALCWREWLELPGEGRRHGS